MTAVDKVIVCPYVQAHPSWQGAHLSISQLRDFPFWIFFSVVVVVFTFKVKKRNASSSLNAAWPGNELNQCMKLIWSQ